MKATIRDTHGRLKTLCKIICSRNFGDPSKLLNTFYMQI